MKSQWDLRRAKIFGRYFILTAAVALLFLWPNTSPAYADVSQLIDTDSHLINSFNKKFQCQTFIATLPNTTSSQATISFEVSNSSAFNLVPTLCLMNDTAETECNTLSATIDGVPNDSNKHIFSGDFPLTAGDITNIDLFNNSTSTKGICFDMSGYYANWYVYGSAADVYADGLAWEVIGGIPNADLADLYFNLGLPAINSISITYPLDSSSLSDFAQFGFTGESVYDLSNVQINIGTASSSFPIFGSNFIIDTAGSFTDTTNKVSALAPGTYWAQAYLETCPAPYNLYSDCIPSVWSNPDNPNGYFEVWAISAPISFTILPILDNFMGTGSSTMGYYYTTSTISSSTPIQITCDPNDPWYAYSFCKLGVALFMPSPTVLNGWANLGDFVKTKAPIGYFYSFVQALGGFNTSSTPSFVLTGISALTDIISPLDIGLAGVIYFLFCFWGFHRLRKLKID
jgi:hypothetical protein